jgi:hypothetical protein
MLSLADQESLHRLCSANRDTLARCSRAGAPGRLHPVDAEAVPPNKRLKLAGDDRFKGSGVFVRWRARTVVQQHCALRARRPQLKRDPLGGSAE